MTKLLKNMAKKETKKTPNVAEQLKKFNANIADEEVVEKHDISKYGFKKKEPIVDEPIVSEVPNIPHEKISKEELLSLVQRVQTIQGGLKQEIISDIENDTDSEQICEKILQIQTCDLRIINEILLNL